MIRTFPDKRRCASLLAAVLVAAGATFCDSLANNASIRIVVTARSPGFYLLQKDAGGRMVATDKPLSPQIWGRAHSLPSPMLWEPDESNGDAVLRSIRRRLLGQEVYGYGGIAISCAPRWTRIYGFNMPMRVLEVMRDKGRFALIGTGSQVGLNVYGPSFYAADPIRIVFSLPKAVPTGTNYDVRGDAGPCPALVLADFQVDTTLSTSAPPAGTPQSSQPPRIGMTRESLIWSRGYPWEIGDVRSLRNEATWYYGVSLGAYSVRFTNDRVSAVSPNEARN